MSTYSVYNIKVDSGLYFTPGPTAGHVLAIAADGSTYWSQRATADTKTFQTLTDDTTIGWTYSLGYNAVVTLGATRSLTITGATNGDYGTLKIVQGNTGSTITTWPTPSKFVGGTYSLSTPNGSIDVFTFVHDGTSFLWNYGKLYS